MDWIAVVIFLGFVLISALARAAKQSGSGQRPPQYPGPVAGGPWRSPGAPPSTTWSQSSQQRPPQRPAVPWQPPAAPEPVREVRGPLVTAADLRREVVDTETEAIDAEAERISQEAQWLAAQAERLGREAEERGSAGRIVAEADRLGGLEGANVAQRPTPAYAQLPSSPAAVVSWLNSENLGHAMVLAEVLGPPKSMTPRWVSTVRHHQKLPVSGGPKS